MKYFMRHNTVQLRLIIEEFGFQNDFAPAQKRSRMDSHAELPAGMEPPPVSVQGG